MFVRCLVLFFFILGGLQASSGNSNCHSISRLSNTYGLFIEKQLEAGEVILNDIQAKQLGDASNYSVQAGGKRIRPLLAIIMAEYYSVPVDEIKPVIRGLEFLHTSSLIFDDLPAQDNAVLRRSRTCLHLQCQSEALAQLSGINLILKSLGELGALRPYFLAERILDLNAYWAESAQILSVGQWKDLSVRDRRDLDYFWELIHLKTGVAIEASLLSIPILVGAPSREKDQLKDLAKHLGRMFQLKDDLLDVIGDETKTGKQMGIDEKNNRLTAVSVLGLNGAEAQLLKEQDQSLKILQKLDRPIPALEGLIDWLLKRTN